MKKAYFSIVLFLCGLSVGNGFAAASAAAAAAEEAAPVAGYLGAELRAAVWRGDKAEVEKLIAIGADVNDADQAGYTALIYAAMRDEVDIVKLLLKAGADVNAVHQGGYTALIFAASNGHTAIVELLLQEEGIEVDATDPEGSTALMWAAMRGRAGIVQKLLDAGADRTIQNNRGQTAETLARDNVIADMIRDYILSGRRTKRAR